MGLIKGWWVWNPWPDFHGRKPAQTLPMQARCAPGITTDQGGIRSSIVTHSIAVSLVLALMGDGIP